MVEFNRTSPCGNCPFLKDRTKAIKLRKTRAIEIGLHLLSQGHFICHYDLDTIENEADRNHCAGALIVLEAIEKPNQMMRIAERLGFYDRFALKGKELVFDSVKDFMELGGDYDRLEH